jgi:hypothetical protein
MPRGIRCEAHHHTAVVAEERHHLQPLSRGGLTVAANMRWLCANAHSDAHYLLDLIEDNAVPLVGGNWRPITAYKAIPAATRRTYGRGVTDAALAGWDRYAARFLEGEFRAVRLLWHTSGQPRTANQLTPIPPPYQVANQHDTVASWVGAVERAEQPS